MCWRHLANTIELVLPLTHQGPQPKRQTESFSHFLHGSQQSVIRHIGAICQILLTFSSFRSTKSTNQTANRFVQPFLHSSWPSAVGHIGAIWQIQLNLCFLGPTRIHNPNSNLIGSAVFAQLMAESLYLQWVPLTPKLSLPMGDLHPI